MLISKYERRVGGWVLFVVDNSYNHDHAQHLEGHEYAKSLTPTEYKMVANLWSQMEPCGILQTIRYENPKCMVTSITIYNGIHKIHEESNVVKTSMHILFSLLHLKEYVHFSPHNAHTKEWKKFFIHTKLPFTNLFLLRPQPTKHIF